MPYVKVNSRRGLATGAQETVDLEMDLGDGIGGPTLDVLLAGMAGLVRDYCTARTTPSEE